MFAAVFRQKHYKGYTKMVLLVEHHTRKAEYATVADFRENWESMLRDYRIMCRVKGEKMTLPGAIARMEEQYSWDFWPQIFDNVFDIDESTEEANGNEDE